jgi:hypothetical protein
MAELGGRVFFGDWLEEAREMSPVPEKTKYPQ